MFKIKLLSTDVLLAMENSVRLAMNLSPLKKFMTAFKEETILQLTIKTKVQEFLLQGTRST
jgi:hypothetical protein